MALITCPECTKKVSDSAISCPNCGFVISYVPETKAAGVRLTTIQETSKKLKMQNAISLTIAIIGIIWFFVAITRTDMGGRNWNTILAFFMMIIGLVWLLVTKFRIWWHHK